LECCACSLDDDPFPNFPSNDEMIAHLERHIAAGHLVPDYCLRRLRDPRDAAENAAYRATRQRETATE
jgi:hypothetical protein